MKKSVTMLLAIMMVIAILAVPAAAETTYKESIRIATTGDMPSAFPYGNSSTQTSIATNSTHEGLVKVAADGSATPVLATEWSANEDSSVWTFKIREGVKFHDGSDLTAEDVKFTWEYSSDTANDGVNWVITGASLIDTIEVPDAYTVIFNMKSSTPDWLFYAAQKIISKSAVEARGGEMGGRIGTGPYVHTAQETGVSWVISRNENYWGEKPVTKQITFVVITDASTRALTLKSGDVDAIFEANATDIVSFMADSNYNVYKAENSANVYIGMNCANSSVCENAIVRRAVAMSVNRDDVVNACYENGACAVPSYNIINNVTPGYVDVEAVPYDPEGAAKLLADNGISNLTLNLVTFAKYKSLAEVVQADLSLAGINVVVNEIAQSGFTGSLRSDPTKYDMYINATSSSGGVLNIVSRFFKTDSTVTAMYYSDPTFDAMLEEGMASKTYDEMIAAYGGMQEYLAQTLPAIPLAQTYLWCIGSTGFSGVDLGTQTYEVNFTNACVAQ